MMMVAEWFNSVVLKLDNRKIHWIVGREGGISAI